MIPILYEKDETAFVSNGLGRLRDMTECTVSEERNGIYECDFEYPVDGANYELIQVGRIIGVTHDETGDIQPFDIVSYSRPIDGIVTFHCVHISYRQTALTVSGTNINSLSAAFTMLGGAVPSNPFTYWSDKTSTGFLASGDGVPHSVRSILGGMEGSILDAYGGEYEWDKWTTKLWNSRGSLKDFTIRYGVNLTEFTDEMDYTDTYTSVVPYWVGQDADGNDTIIKGDMQSASYPSFNGTGRCIPLDVTDKFNTEDGMPTKAQVEAQGLAYINANQPYMPAQNIQVDFVRISDSSEYAQFAPLQTCGLCDTINVIFDKYGITGTFKIVKTEWDVLRGKYNKLELGGLSITLSEALGINQEASNRLRVASGGTTNYNELTNKPSVNGVTLSGNKSLSDLGINIPTVNDATLTIQKNGSTVKTFTANASSNVTANITVPTKVSDLSNDSNFVPASSLAAVATSGDYDDLTDKPTIPTVNDATLTIQKNGTDVQTFTANASSNATANITVPTATSDLSNDSGFITSPNVVYCTCATEAATAAKVATVVSGSLSSLTTGTQAIVKFTYANGVASPKLNVNSTGAKIIRRYGTTSPSTSAASSWNAGSCVLFIYDGTYWQMAGWLNTTYSVISQANITNSASTASGLITGTRARQAVAAHESVNDVQVNGTSVVSSKVASVTVPTATATTPLMDGTADVGSETTWAKGDHVHPSDTSKQDTLVSGTNIKTINNQTLLGSGNISISGGGGTSDYDQLSNRPQINSVTLTGNKTTSDLSIHDIPSGGTSGQVLAKNSGTNYDVGWVNQSGGGAGEKEVKEGCTVFRFDNLRIVRLDTPSAWCATLWAKDRPSATVEYSGVVYNGSTYVDCLVLVNTSGEVRVTTLYGGTVSGAQYGYLRPRWITYFV